ncbi:uncharacterized protein LOC111052821 [Nilaparvata lugens]|uniref:uncharacterized protein LOC111052821 n=1 Tax=Nilaparvata lugens TaxID=108931 RepID=UPI00193D293C|nr:uncharacterized protein LOC111052821 [Nilaparvata lugens]XP_039288103.1 uncharacterized protein LOC111052821 [Nilaparvata lugens]XP_039288110.1 uncharacterized protein LOC111052821 [Nilaparvata lugens]XP_039288118.1 uncharacterized protein LOC111052821 [Nilaparvata lugens]
MAPKKRSTSYNQRSRRPSRMKESVSCSVFLEDVDPVQSSTPKQDRTRSTFKLTKKEISKAAEELTAEIQNKIDEYVKSATLFKLSLKRQLLKAPLWQFEEYRENYAVDVIKIDENIENVEPMCSSRRLRTSSVDRFKKPAPVAIKQTGGRVSRSATRSRNSAMKTPYMTSQFGWAEMTPITPKFDINTPVSVLRQPRLGEQAVSLSGSPLHVAIPTATNPTVNVPLSDGNVVTILPPLSQSNRPHAPPVALDPECRHKLQTIQMYLTHMLSGYNSD